MGLEQRDVYAFSDTAFWIVSFGFQAGNFFGQGAYALAPLAAEYFQDTPSSVVLEDSENVAL
jgi:hypothetical protein